MPYEKTEAQEKDYKAVYFGKVHNIGAGGVDFDSSLNLIAKDKRAAQWAKRTDRAAGIQPYWVL